MAFPLQVYRTTHTADVDGARPGEIEHTPQTALPITAAPPAEKESKMHSAIDNLTNQMKSRLDMIVATSNRIADNGDVHSSGFRGLRPGAFRRVREYILTHPAENISNRVLAQLVGLSPFHFARAFKQSAGVSPHRFVLYSRVERVKHLLAETDLPLAQIALTAGFADQSHCTRQFRELVGMTPGRFRWLRR